MKAINVNLSEEQVRNGVDVCFAVTIKNSNDEAGTVFEQSINLRIGFDIESRLSELSEQGRRDFDHRTQ